MRRREFIRLFGSAAVWSLGPARAQPQVEDYENYRTRLIDLYYDNQLETLVSRFQPNRKTVILLPGGMASQLQRTREAFPTWPNVPQDVIWLNVGLLTLRDGLKLEIDDAGKDKDAYVVVAHGPITFFKERPYQKLEDRARGRGWNYSVFGFDWRRPLTESSANFASFIREFRERVRKRFGTDPIPDLTIVCHSMGGLVATHALRDEDFSGLGFNAVMTIATPFYGTSNQQDRYFVGEKSLKKLRYRAEDIVRIIASLPGPYTLMFLPKEVFDRDRSRIGLEDYPQRNPSHNPCDPFDSAMKQRWPKVVRDHWQYIENAKKEMIDIADPIKPNIAPKFFNVRSELDRGTAVELIWGDVPGDSIDPNGPSPLEPIQGPGDGTVPAWSAFHAYCENENRHDLTQTEKTEHAYLLTNSEVLTLIENVVTTGKLSAGHPKLRKKGAERPPAPSAEEVDSAMTKWVAESKGKRVLRPPPPVVQRALVASLIGGTKPRMAAK